MEAGRRHHTNVYGPLRLTYCRRSPWLVRGREHSASSRAMKPVSELDKCLTPEDKAAIERMVDEERPGIVARIAAARVSQARSPHHCSRSMLP